jgi:hypothetical protein
MIRAPRTKDEAEKYRYNEWAGNPKGRAYDPRRCAYEVWQNHLSYQCSKKPGKGPDGLYCGQHAKRVSL